MGFPQISLTYPKKKMSSKEGDVIREDRNKMNFRDSQELLRHDLISKRGGVQMREGHQKAM